MDDDINALHCLAFGLCQKFGKGGSADSGGSLGGAGTVPWSILDGALTTSE